MVLLLQSDITLTCQYNTILVKIKTTGARPQKGVISVRFSCKFSKSAGPMQIGRFLGGANDSGQVNGCRVYVVWTTRVLERGVERGAENAMYIRTGDTRLISN